MDSGSYSPLSFTTTLSCPDSPRLKYSLSDVQQSAFKTSLISASDIVELISSRSTSTSAVYVYDLAEQVGFGTLTKSWSATGKDTASVVSLQARSGAGSTLVGRLSMGTSVETMTGAVLTAYTTPLGLSMMAHSLSYLPPATPTSRLVVQVPRVVTVGETFALSPSLASLATSLPLLPRDAVVILSATAQESVDFAALSYSFTDSHVIHLFDHFCSSREIGHPLVPPLFSEDISSLPVLDAIKSAGYTPFEYLGDKNAHTVIAMLNGPLALSAKVLAGRIPQIGVVIVKVLRPWDEALLRAVLPRTVRQVHVLDDVPHTATVGSLYVDVFGSLIETGLPVHAHRIVPSRTETFISEPSAFALFLSGLVPSAQVAAPSLKSTDRGKKLLFFGTPRSALTHLPRLVEETFISNNAISARLLRDYDVVSKPGGITIDRILLSQKSDNDPNVPIPVALPLAADSQGESDFLAILDHGLLQSHSLLKYAKPGSTVLVSTSWDGPTLGSNLPPDVLSLVVERGLRIYIIDAQMLAAKLVGADGHPQDAVQNLIVHHAFLRLFIGSAATEAKVQAVARATLEDEVQGIQLIEIGAEAWAGLCEVEIPPSVLDNTVAPSSLREIEINSMVADAEKDDSPIDVARLGSWHDAVQHIIFPTAFSPPAQVSLTALRPEVPDRTYLVTCTVNRRLTPTEYDRNVFHLEFDTSGTGLKYAIGEALGIHGWNDEQEVLDFCAWYGVDPDRVITIPLPAGAGGDGKTMHTRTVMQALQQQIDLFGRPPKSFYTDLAPYATNKLEKMALMFIGSPEGSATLKKLAEKDTVTFVDVLKLYPSARPGIERLCDLVGDTKPRHYSIASAQSVVGDRVDLLVVTVEWTTPNGMPRYGQCTRYLAGLRPGQKVTVSIKPSVMKLPPDDKQPIIMAGLGTGAAPFRAFLQHRAWLAQQQTPVGPTYYYFGSRHQSQEYLYGEDLEAFIADGTITQAGLAFSRDGPRKVYIQHKMAEDERELADMLYDDKGAFYLCGPTWPVPDVYEALVRALVKFKGLEPEAAGAFLEGLKEEERYVLEVY